jgi:hypothetical protein
MKIYCYIDKGERESCLEEKIGFCPVRDNMLVENENIPSLFRRPQSGIYILPAIVEKHTVDSSS